MHVSTPGGAKKPITSPKAEIPQRATAFSSLLFFPIPKPAFSRFRCRNRFLHLATQPSPAQCGACGHPGERSPPGVLSARCSQPTIGPQSRVWLLLPQAPPIRPMSPMVVLSPRPPTCSAVAISSRRRLLPLVRRARKQFVPLIIPEDLSAAYSSQPNLSSLFPIGLLCRHEHQPPPAPFCSVREELIRHR
ncbi:hypothetical protein E2562_008016 [Oryza meyeriana var. granulata]|uniref:Uncharacterized protein n=1 Tax=Oryza meyeriana var. granulata TaxID=110450 RepID=A0A6G1DFH6_9ORYZ|nr:hypothetical protein E2562_008016 [Oryza meyeriana var. granulata]